MPHQISNDWKQWELPSDCRRVYAGTGNQLFSIGAFKAGGDMDK